MAERLDRMSFGRDERPPVPHHAVASPQTADDLRISVIGPPQTARQHRIARTPDDRPLEVGWIAGVDRGPLGLWLGVKDVVPEPGIESRRHQLTVETVWTPRS